MKKLEEVFVPEAARQNALWSELRVQGSEKKLCNAAKNANRGQILVLKQPSKKLSRKALEQLKSLEDPQEVEVAGPDGTITPGWAFNTSGPAAVKRLRNQLGQQFHWEMTTKRLHVVSSGSNPWRRTRSAPKGAIEGWRKNELSFEEATLAAFGKQIHGSQKRLRATGWAPKIALPLPCPNCALDLRLFHSLQRLRSGLFRDLHAVVCEDCEEVWFPDQLPRPWNRAAEAIGAWTLTRQDLPSDSTNQFSCYIINLHDQSGMSLGIDRDWKYVGYTSDLEGRLEQHRSRHPLSSKWTKRFFDSVDHGRTAEVVNKFGSEAEAMAYERYLAAALEAAGYGVKSN